MPYPLEEAKKRVWRLSQINPRLPDHITFEHRGKTISFELHDYFEYVKLSIIGADCFYEWDVLDYISDQYGSLIKGSVIVDVGGNIGNHSRYFEEYLNPKCVHTFEPDPDNFRLLKKNVHKPTTFLHNRALGNENKEVGLYNWNQNNNSGTVAVTEGTGTMMVRLDDFSLRDVALLKVDVEGFEADVLRGAELTIKACRPVVFIEPNKQDAIDLLKSYGYSEGKTFEVDSVKTTEYIP